MDDRLKYCTKKRGKTEVYPFWNLEDIQGMIDAFTAKQQWHWRLAFMTGILMGRRVGDIMNLEWADFYEENGRKKTHLQITEEKTGKETNILIPELLWSEIELYKQNAKSIPEVRVFPGDGNINSSFRKAFKKAAAAAGIEYPVSTHSMRKTFGYYGVKLHPHDPANLDVLQKFFNHSDRNTTLRYIGLTQEKQDQYSKDWGDVVKDISEGKEMTIDNAPVVSLKTADLRRILIEAMECESTVGNLDKLIAMVDELRIPS